LKKNSKTTKEFIDQSIGEWKSIRSSHSLSFQEFENTKSNIIISYLDNCNEEVKNLLQKFNFTLKPEFSVSITWESYTDWVENQQSIPKETILIFLPKDKTSGLILRSQGYAELVSSCSTYFMDKNHNLDIFTEYSSIKSHERIWFLSQNVRVRYSCIKNKNHDSVIQTSHSSEIRKIIT